MHNFDRPLFKKLAHNDTGSAAGHQSGVVVPKAIDKYFPQLSSAVSASVPTVSCDLQAALFVGTNQVGFVKTRYQYQTWSGTRPPERRITGQLGPLLSGAFLYLGGFALAIEQRVPTGLVALISDLLPLAIAVLSQPVLGERLSKWQWLGTAIAVFGVLIVSFDGLTFGSAPLWAYGLTVGSMLVFALASVIFRGRQSLHMPVHQSLCFQTLIGAVLFGISAVLQGDGLAPPLTGSFAFGMVWLVLISTFATYFVYYTSLKLFPVAKVSAAIYLSPPVTMIWAWLMFSEPLTLTMFAGLGVTLAGVFLTSRN